MLQFLPMALGAVGGALTNKEPLTGALMGAGLGAVTGGLGGLGGAAAGATGAGSALTTANAAAPAAGLLSGGGMKTVGDLAGMAGKMGLMDGHQGPQAQSAGIPGRQADFTGLLSAGRGGQPTGAQMLIAQRQARRG